ncbi:reverse transcriptase domain-containing protein [Novipirellula sp. SH528]|uniref:reverse transcriptase domain-containing protein n=1 Tax=Novipirellula sp. SH528 TaxID=3454466 RepID=UPI003FA132E2
MFDPGFSESSFGYRPYRSAQDAAKQVQKIIRSGRRRCVDMDLSKFFDRVQHDVLMARVSRKVHDNRLLKLIGRYLRFRSDDRWSMSTKRRRNDAGRSALTTPFQHLFG